MSLKEFDKTIQVLWNAIKDMQQENEKLKEDIKKLEEGLFMCNELMTNYKECNENAIVWIETNINYMPNIAKLKRILNNGEDK